MLILLIAGFISAIIAYKLPGLFLLSSIFINILFGEFINTFIIGKIGGNVYIVDIYILALHIFFIFWIVSKGNKNVKHKEIIYIIYLYYFVFMINVLRGLLLYGHTAFGLGRHFGFYTFYFFVVIHYLDKSNNPRKTLNWIIRVGTLALIVGVFDYFVLLSIGSGHPHRAFGGFRALLIASAFISLLSTKLTKVKIYNNFITNFFITLFFIGVLISTQRKIWLGLLISLSIGGFIFNFKRMIRYSFVFLPILFLILIVIQVYIGQQQFTVIKSDISSRFSGIISYGEDISSSTRLIAWAAYFKRFKKQPILGEGVGKREYYYMPLPTRYASNWIAMEAHNQYLMIATQRGVIGLIPLLIIILYVFNWLIKHKSKSSYNDFYYVLSIISGLIVICAAVYQFFSNGDDFFWIALGIFHYYICSYQTNINELISNEYTTNSLHSYNSKEDR